MIFCRFFVFFYKLYTFLHSEAIFCCFDPFFCVFLQHFAILSDFLCFWPPDPIFCQFLTVWGYFLMFFCLFLTFLAWIGKKQRFWTPKGGQNDHFFRQAPFQTPPVWATGHPPRMGPPLATALCRNSGRLQNTPIFGPKPPFFHEFCFPSPSSWTPSPRPRREDCNPKGPVLACQLATPPGD